MADPTLIVPYLDPYDENEQLINMVDFYNPYIDNLLSVVEPSSRFPSPTTDITNLIADNNDLFSEPIWGNLHDQDTNYGVMPQIDHDYGTSNSGYGICQSEDADMAGEDADMAGENLEIGNDVWPISVWLPQPADSISCHSCTVLREIIHTNGHQTTKLDIHGRIGMICHAILETEEDVFSASSSAKTRQMIDMKSIENVKEFLVQYCQERKQSGFMMMPDDLSTFYDALYAVGLNSDDWSIDNLLEPFSDDFEETDQINHQPEYETVPNENVSNRNIANRKRSRRPSLSEQRQRIASMSLNDITALFHLPIDEAAKRMALCSTVVKKICRRDGLVRWPHRKVKSLQKKIEKLRPVLNSFNEEDIANAQAQIQEFEQQLQDIFNGAYTSLRGRQ